IKAGIEYADAFYFGAKKFNMRMRADNFNDRDLINAVKMCHDRGKKAYFVSNILVYENELDDLTRALEYAYYQGKFDAAIVNDLSAVEICKEIGLPFHISTQQNVSNYRSAQFFESLGTERIIMARECNLEQIKEISDKLNTTEVEAFVHGAMCTMISGRCYFSMDVCGGEEGSANRGLCVQPCRREWTVTDNKTNEYIYDGVRFFNSRDLCMIGYIPEMIEAGIASFKIEGRMREPHYVDIVSKIYRNAIDEYYNGIYTKDSKKMVGKWIYELKKVYNRGFTQGFYFKRATQEDQQHNSPTNLSHWRMIKMGTITRFSRKNELAQIILNNGSLKKGMDVIIQGGPNSNSDTYFHQKIKKIVLNDKEVKATPKASKEKSVKVWIGIDQPVRSNNSDFIFIFTDKTYKHRQGKTLKRKKDYYKL
ncbi:MAG: peptidase U32 family protein, partial [Promethearchaeota archaeon]